MKNLTNHSLKLDTLQNCDDDCEVRLFELPNQKN